MNEHRLHSIFRASVVLKGLHAVIECLGGITLYVLNTAQITQIVSSLTQHELAEDPHDLIAGYLLHGAQTLSISTLSFYAFYLVSHGVIKLLLVAGLLRGTRAAYPFCRCLPLRRSSSINFTATARLAAWPFCCSPPSTSW